jgi:hypothetical protein
MGLGRDRGGVILRYGGEECDVILIRMDGSVRWPCRSGPAVLFQFRERK